MKKKGDDETKLKEPLLITKSDPPYHGEFYSVAKTKEELLRDFESAIDDGEHSVFDIMLWKRIEKLAKKPPGGQYIVATADKTDGPFEVHGETFCHETICQGLHNAERNLVRGTEEVWVVQAWMRVDVSVEACIRVTGIWLPSSKTRKRRKRIA